MEPENIKRSTPLPKRIKIRKIRSGNITKASVNKNCPKFIIGHCWMGKKDQILRKCPNQIKVSLQQTFRLVERWFMMGDRDKLTLNHLKELFGTTSDGVESNRRHECSKVFFNFLSQNMIDIVLQNKKVEKVLSYLICLQKFTARLGHPDLVNKLQFK